MTERDVESYLVRQVRLAGGHAYKFASPARRGVPDRIVCLPGGGLVFVELKASGKLPTALQELEHGRLRALGQRVVVCDSKEAVNALLS